MGSEMCIRDRSSDSNGWTKAHLLVNGHQFCDDFVGYKTMIDIDISGMLIVC